MVAQGEGFVFGGGCGDRSGEVAFVQVVAGLPVVGPVLGLGEVDGVGAEGNDGTGRGVEGPGVGVGPSSAKHSPKTMSHSENRSGPGFWNDTQSAH